MSRAGSSRSALRASALALAFLILLALAPATQAAGLPKISINDVEGAEPTGSAGGAPADFVFEVTLSKRAKKKVSVGFDAQETGAETTQDDATEGQDFNSSAGTVVIPKKKRKARIAVEVRPDDEVEEDETFKVVLKGPRRAKLRDDTGIGTITDNESDLDGDGVPDDVDLCPQDPNPNGGPCPATLYVVNNGATSGPVRVTATVTAVKSGRAWVAHQPSDPDWVGVSNSAIEVDLSGVAPAPSLAVGDIVSVSGTPAGDVLMASAVTETGTQAVTTHSVAGGDLDQASGSSPGLNDVLVSVSTVSIDNIENDGDWTLSNDVRVDDGIAALPDYPEGTSFTSIAGIATTGSTPPVVSPRSSSDIVLAPPTLESLSVPACLDETASGLGSVELSNPAPPGDIVVGLASSANVEVPASVTVAAGQTSASFVVTALDNGQATITASLGLASIAEDFEVADSSDPCSGPPPHILINEVDYDQPSTDTAEFVEIFNPTSDPVPLANLAVVLVNGSSSQLEYARVGLAGAGTSLPAGGYLLVRNSGVSVPAGALSVGLADGTMQNGSPDAVALIDTSTLEVLDALSYEGPVTAAQITGFASTADLTDGHPVTTQIDEGSGVASLARLPNGTDTNRQSADWALSATPTPGAQNSP